MADAKLRAKANYFIGNDPARWRTNVSNFSRIRYQAIYPGIDLVFYSNAAGQLEYDYIIAPGADANRISLSIEGADNVVVDPGGDLIITVGGEQVHWRSPSIFQESGGIRAEVAGRYVVRPTDLNGSAHEVSFNICQYDRSAALIIDPALLYSTFLGGSSEADDPADIALDSEGNAYLTGSTTSPDFPTKNAFQSGLAGTLKDIFVTKFDSSGQLVYSTYVGGSGWDGNPGIEQAGLEVAADGSVIVAGLTRSADFPTQNAIQSRHADEGIVAENQRMDCFVFRLSPGGSALIFSTYFGGTGRDVPTAMALDRSGNIHVVGSTTSTNFPIKAAMQSAHAGVVDAFVFKLDVAGQELLYSIISEAPIPIWRRLSC